MANYKGQRETSTVFPATTITIRVRSGPDQTVFRGPPKVREEIQDTTYPTQSNNRGLIALLVYWSPGVVAVELAYRLETASSEPEPPGLIDRSSVSPYFKSSLWIRAESTLVVRFKESPCGSDRKVPHHSTTRVGYLGHALVTLVICYCACWAVHQCSNANQVD